MIPTNKYSSVQKSLEILGNPGQIVLRYVYDYKLSVCFDLILYVPLTIFQLYRDGSSWIEPVQSKSKISDTQLQRHGIAGGQKSYLQNLCLLHRNVFVDSKFISHSVTCRLLVVTRK